MTYIAKPNQLAFDISVQQVPKKESFDAKNSFKLHLQDSNILKDSFNIKITLEWRSYVLVWRYKIVDLRSYAISEDYEKTLAYVAIDKVMKFQWFMYLASKLPKREMLKFERILKQVLSNPSYNSNLSE